SLERQLDQLETLSSISNSLSDLRDQSLDMLELQKGIEFGLVGSKPSVFSKNAHVNLVDEIVALKGLVEEIDSELKISVTKSSEQIASVAERISMTILARTRSSSAAPV